tara:strand:- start:350 stop:721 length:372 start_codon:yes stop_codon:yes gene_type:complete
MKRYLVKFYGENDAGIPAEWPSDKDECTDFDNLPSDCTLMNDEQYEAHISKYKHLYDAWNVKRLYKQKYKEQRKREYPSNEEMIEAIFEVLCDRLIDKRNFPKKIQKLIDRRAEVNKKYPEPE